MNLRPHRHHYIFARPSTYPGADVYVCSVDRCPARTLRPHADDRMCGHCRAGRHDRRCCACCAVLPTPMTNAGARTPAPSSTR